MLALKTATVLVTCLACLTSPMLAHADMPLHGPGITAMVIEDQRTDRPLTGTVWYPSSTPETKTRPDESAVWIMAEEDRDGPPADGLFPLVVVSHGMYGNVRNQAWLASELAQRGFIVAMINHPGTSTFDRDADQARQLWDRPVDLSRLVTYLLMESAFRDLIDAERVHAIGHSLGGFTVMMVAGAEFDTEVYRNGCFGETRIPVVCDVLGQWSVALTEEDRREMARSRKDPRVRKVVSLDLGGTPVLSRESLAKIDIPVLVLGSGRADMLDQDLESRSLAAGLPTDLVVHIEPEDAGHFDYMGVCKPDGFAILEKHEPGDEIVCVKGGVERERRHRLILDAILGFLSD